MADKFKLGGLYRHNKYGYVECVNKIDDVAVFRTLRHNEKLVAFDGDGSYNEPERGLLDSHVARVEEELRYLEEKFGKERKYLAKLEGVWPNMQKDDWAPRDIGLGPVQVGKDWTDAMNDKAVRNVSIDGPSINITVASGASVEDVIDAVHEKMDEISGEAE